MMCVHLLKAGCFLLAVLASSPASAQQTQPYTESAIEPHTFDRDRWASAKKGIDYTEEAPKEEAAEHKQQSDNQRGGGDRPPPEPYDPPMSGATAEILLKFLAFAGAAVLLAFLLRYLLGLQRAPRNEKIRQAGRSGPIDLDQIEEELHEAELKDYIQQAIAKGNYSLALRLHYLDILKLLSQRRLIHWKKDKTNRQYLLELSAHPLQPDFSELTRTFEHHWYGRHPLAAEDYPDLANRFRLLERDITESSTAHAE